MQIIDNLAVKSLTMEMKGFISALIITTMVAYSFATANATTAKSSNASVIRDLTKQLSNPPPSWVHGGGVYVVAPLWASLVTALDGSQALASLSRAGLSL